MIFICRNAPQSSHINDSSANKSAMLAQETSKLLSNDSMDLVLPSIYQFLPHLLKTPHSLQPAFKKSQGRNSGKKWMLIFIVSSCHVRPWPLQEGLPRSRLIQCRPYLASILTRNGYVRVCTDTVCLRNLYKPGNKPMHIEEVIFIYLKLSVNVFQIMPFKATSLQNYWIQNPFRFMFLLQ